MDPGISATNDSNQVVPSCPTVKSEKEAAVAVEEVMPRWLFTAAELDDTPSRLDKMDKAQVRAADARRMVHSSSQWAYMCQ